MTYSLNDLLAYVESNIQNENAILETNKFSKTDIALSLGGVYIKLRRSQKSVPDIEYIENLIDTLISGSKYDELIDFERELKFITCFKILTSKYNKALVYNRQDNLDMYGNRHIHIADLKISDFDKTFRLYSDWPMPKTRYVLALQFTKDNTNKTSISLSLKQSNNLESLSIVDSTYRQSNLMEVVSLISSDLKSNRESLFKLLPILKPYVLDYNECAEFIYNNIETNKLTSKSKIVEFMATIQGIEMPESYKNMIESLDIDYKSAVTNLHMSKLNLDPIALPEI